MALGSDITLGSDKNFFSGSAFFSLTKNPACPTIGEDPAGHMLANTVITMVLGRLGERIRERRRDLKKTLQEVADASGLSVGFISQIERNLTVPSLSSLAMVAEVLDISIGDLTGQPAAPNPKTRQDNRTPYSLEAGQVRYERLSSVFPGSALHSVKFTMPCGYRSETVSHHGEELVFVIRGRIQYRVLKEVFVLDEGDSLHFDATKPHSIEAMPHEAGVAVVVWTGTLDIFDGETEASSVTAESLTGTEFRALAH
ncbi:helix-turn-helix domain-containing protein [Methylobacterium sp. J-077]|uniref:helix-turn-helix domain-containing protein n=1 Tax=Methylobacterium sp. J-077 TaxID=2836656 RepID=UPI001FBA1FCF|nr:XRE family transcriptional regulator [Methylobacterium sp. J-077]MCJ2121191.1 XRE family transcriptional regulator [Methylobacterium sp. J-077]